MNADSKMILSSLLIVGGLVLGVIMAIFVVTNPSGGLAALVPMVTFVLSILSLLNPRAGLFGLVPLVIWVDEFKRLAVYFGGPSSTTVYQTLAMPFIVLAALNCGLLLHAMFGKIKLDRIFYVFYLLAFILGVAVFASTEGSIPARGQRAANLAGYISVVPIVYTYLRTLRDWQKFFSFQVVIALPAALWAIKQYYFGFDDIEWYYAKTGLSLVHSNQMLNMINPRTFGLFGSASALGCAGIYCAYAWWRGFSAERKRLLWIICAVLLTWVLYCSTQRTALLYPLIAFMASFLFRTRIRVAATYVAAITLFVIGVMNATYLLNEGLEITNEAIATEGGWGSQVVVVSTFSDRLVGWERLSRSSSWTLFGTEANRKSGTLGYFSGSEDENHDLINKILISYGAAGLSIIAIFGSFIARYLHQSVFLANTRQARNEAAFVLALALPVIGMSFVAGDNFSTNPINLQIWTCLAGVFIARKESLNLRRSGELVIRQEGRQPEALSGLKPLGQV